MQNNLIWTVTGNILTQSDGASSHIKWDIIKNNHKNLKTLLTEVDISARRENDCMSFDEYYKYQGVKEFRMLARIGSL